jgi:hypothetical protein
MSELLRIEGLDEAAACSLIDRLAGTLPARHEPSGHELRSVAIDAGGGGDALSELLTLLREWLSASGVRSVRISLDGRTYLFEA